MAFSPKKISPLDLRPSIGVGVSLPFSYATAFRTTYTTKEAIKSNLINFFLTNKGERYLNPTFGGDLRRFIFTQITDGNLDFLKEDIQSQVAQYFPNVIVKELSVFQGQGTQEQQVTIKMVYNVANTNTTDSLEILFN
jgi:phage baseplate assembly protein W